MKEFCEKIEDLHIAAGYPQHPYIRKLEQKDNLLAMTRPLLDNIRTMIRSGKAGEEDEFEEALGQLVYTAGRVAALNGIDLEVKINEIHKRNLDAVSSAKTG